MNFTTPIFLFVFFPITVLIFFGIDIMERRKIFYPFLAKFRIKDLSLIAMSLLFYMWACFDDVIKLLIYMLGVWIAGHCICHDNRFYVTVYEQKKGEEDRVSKKIKVSVFILFFAISLIVLCLIHFKYASLLTTIWNYLLRDTLVKGSILAPVGISFITFSAISYLVDIYRGDTRGGSFIDCVLYLSFFPKVISGPIVLWKDFAPMLEKQLITSEGVVSGLNRIMIGFAQKLILADQFGLCISRVSVSGTDVMTGWGIAFLYMLQIYYDFSGYSDIAIGLARLLGFEFQENFHFPYRSTSISEFWRRWHISLGRWFREYVYFPLGGSRRGEHRAICNVAVVFAVTGIWHGAGWNYLLWGGINGAMVILERLLKEKKFYQKQPVISKWFVTMSVTFFCWQFFRFPSFSESLEWLKLMFGAFRQQHIYFSWRYYFDAQIITLAVIGAVGAVLPGDAGIQRWYQRFSGKKAGFLIQEVGLMLLFMIAVLFMINSTYSPFIYFQY